LAKKIPRAAEPAGVQAILLKTRLNMKKKIPDLAQAEEEAVIRTVITLNLVTMRLVVLLFSSNTKNYKHSNTLVVYRQLDEVCKGPVSDLEVF
jgi:hypothetical protein